MWTGARWEELTAPPPILPRITLPEAGKLAAPAATWENLPAVIPAGKYALDSAANRIPADIISPFRTPLTDTPGEFEDHIVHVVTDDRTVTLDYHCTLQICGVAPGGTGGGRRVTVNEGGGAGGVMIVVVNGVPGDTLRVDGVNGKAWLNGQLILYPPRGQYTNQGNWATFGSTMGNPRNDVFIREYLPGSQWDVYANQASGARGGGAGNREGDPLVIPWTEGGFRVADGGHSGDPIAAAGRAGLYPGAGGGGQGISAPGTAKPVTPVLAAGTSFNESTRLISWTLVNPEGTPLSMQSDQFRWRYVCLLYTSPSPRD